MIHARGDGLLRGRGNDRAWQGGDRRMFAGMLSGAVGFLALLGGAALVLRLFRTATKVTLNTAEMAAASGLAEAGARRGDLTALDEGRDVERRARTSRRWQLLVTIVLLAWISVPLALGVAAEAYALAAPLWLLPMKPLRESIKRR